MSPNKQDNRDSSGPRREQWAFYAALAFFLVVLVAFIFVLASPDLSLPGPPPADAATATPRQLLTPDATSAVNATRMAEDAFTPLPPAQMVEIDALEAMVANCPDYAEQRRFHMEQHLEWLRNPNQIPEDLVLAFASNPPERLLYGMAVYTLSEWGRVDNPPDSCLVDIGRTINTMLIAVGGEPPGDYSE